MTELLAIHHAEGTYSERWIEYCDQHGVPYKVVNGFASDIMQQLSSARALLWHWHHENPQDALIASQVLMSAKAMGLNVFPNTATRWHFDDKVAQKYFLEALGAPLVPSYVFFDLKSALEWIDRATFPKVFKLRKGAGSANVRLVRDARQARLLAKRAFGAGFKPSAAYLSDARTKFRRIRRRGDWLAVLGRIPRTLRKIRTINRVMGREAGYLYFQDFVPDCQSDTRVTIIGNRAFGATRFVRKDDFRASGSGDANWDPQLIDPRCVRMAFDLTNQINSQSMAYDFIKHPDGEFRLMEISFCFSIYSVTNCPGYWDDSLAWHEGQMWPQDAILMDLLEEIRAMDR
jgi:glutathione synthase/RimK-type ligase-like ATP-grasp enzyme